MSPRRVATVAALELRHAWKRPLWLFLFALMVFVAWGLAAGGVIITVGSQAAAGERAWINSQFNMAMSIAVICTAFYSFWIAIGAGMTLIDDDSHQVGPILRSTPLTGAEYAWGRFLGVVSVFAVLLLLNAILYMLFFELYPIDEPDAARGPFRPLGYLWVFLLFAVPGMTFFAGTSFWLGARTRRPVLVFLLPVAALLACLFFVWNFSPRWLPGWADRLMQAIDPAGIRWIIETYLRERRSVGFYNSSWIVPDATFGLSRLGFVAIGIGAAFLGARAESRRARGVSRPVRDPERVLEEADRTHETSSPGVDSTASLSGTPLAALGMTAARPSVLSAAWVTMRAEFRELVRSPGLYLFVPLIVLQVTGTSLAATGAFDTPLLSSAGTIAARSFNTVTLLSLLLLLFYFTESLWRDQRWKLAPIARATPARTTAVLGGKMLAILVAVQVPILLGTAAAVLLTLAVQAIISSFGGGPSLTDLIGVGPLFRVWAFFLLPTILLWLSFIALVWALTRSRLAVYGIALAALLGSGLLIRYDWTNWVTNWHLWSGVRWTDFGPFELDRRALVLNRLFVLAVAAVLLAVAVRLWPRRTPDPQTVIGRLRPGRVLLGLVWVAAWSLPAVVLGTMLAVEIRHGRDGSILEQRARNYRRANVETWKDVASPAIAEIDAVVELDPPRSGLAVEGRYVLRNTTATPITRFAVTPGAHFEDLAWTFDGRPVEDGDGIAHDSAGLWEFTPPEPIEPGATVTLGFTYHGRYPGQPGRNPGGAWEFILPSGVVLNAFGTSFLPLMGFVDGVGRGDEPTPEGRRPEPDEWRERTEPAFGFAYDTMTRFEIVGPAHFRFNGPGVLERDDVDGDRRTMVWQTDAPIRIANIVGGPLVEHVGESTSIWHLPEHHWNIEQMQSALDGARRWYSEWFWPYPWQDLRLTEFPGLAAYAQGFGTNIVFSESIGFTAREQKDTDAPFMITAHEAAHQWWGNILLPGKGPGGNILSEGLAHFSTAMLTGQIKGDGARANFLRGIERQYVETRVPEDERPMVEVDGTRAGDTTLMYDKGGWVFWMLTRHMGRERALAGFRDFIGQYKDGPDFPLLQDFLAVMRTHAEDPDAFDVVASMWFHEVVLPEYEVEVRAVSDADADGVRTVTADVRNVGTGRMPVEVAVTNGEERWEDRDWSQREAYLDVRQSVTLGPDETATLSFRCPFEPASVVVDPDVQVLQFGRDRAEESIDGSVAPAVAADASEHALDPEA